MSMRSNRLADVLAGIGVIEDLVDDKANLIFGTISMVKDKVQDQYDQAVASDAYETAAEEKAKATAETVVAVVKNVVAPNVKNFFDVVVKPAKDAGFTGNFGDLFGTQDEVEKDIPDFNFTTTGWPEYHAQEPVVSKVLTKDQKIAWIRKYYDDTFGMKSVLPNAESMADEFIDATYEYLKGL